MIRKKRLILIIFGIIATFAKSFAIVSFSDRPTDLPDSRNEALFLQDVPLSSSKTQQDSIKGYILPEFVKKAPYRFPNKKKQEEYYRLIRDVKKTLPYAKEISVIIMETYEYMETLPDDKTRQKHLEKMEKYLFKTYKPKMSKLTRSQGQLLIKLVDRETNSSSYRIIDAFMGSFKAWTYNLFAGIFGNSLKKRYDAQGDDYLIERICQMYEDGLI